jgi:hypothetical protein
LQGSQWYPVTAATTTAPANAAVGDFLLNSGTAALALANQANQAVGAIVRIATLTPSFTGTAAGNIRGAQGAQGAIGAQGAGAGPQGAVGAQGTQGPGVPTGGQQQMLLTKNSGTNFDTGWAFPLGERNVLSHPDVGGPCHVTFAFCGVYVSTAAAGTVVEQGTFTPIFRVGAVTPGAREPVGQWRRMGNLVWFAGSVRNANLTTPDGIVSIGGLPFAASHTPQSMGTPIVIGDLSASMDRTQVAGNLYGNIIQITIRPGATRDRNVVRPPA